VERGVPQGYHLDGVVHGSLADIYKWTEGAHHTLLVGAH
jgi:hypothetical protein